ncbi:Ig-like domain repeat protein [Granulicella tundricola]|uniref:NHL repeat containing protein n=1 Tax=Granulicella tundricola (strain ATCC BAA-1859 / DSM 23138 / MP5ACTX9) TaxID=1198114 RepID=E8WXQ0_GRATM|nr:Ig-like domain repeat protein [Granulicella tundricola]ADW68666.1 NHL repeat containing protein [Granulicella tundricola MP5ACTX9]
MALVVLLLPSQAQTTQATTVPILLPSGLVYDAQGNLYLAETAAHLILRVSPSGALTIVAGTGTQGYAGDGTLPTQALLDSPTALAITPTGDLYLADTHNHAIRRIDAATQIITTVAGTGTPGRSPDGTLATKAQLDTPTAIALDSSQNLYIADTRNHIIRRVDATTHLITTLAGTGTQGFSGDAGPALAAQIDTPTGLALDASNNLYLADTHNHRIRRIDAVTHIITTIAGNGTPAFTSDNIAATSATLYLPRGITLDPSGNLLIADSANHRIRRIDAVTGLITTLAGDGTQTYAGDSTPATTASLDTPRAIALSPATLPTLTDTANQRIRQIDTAAVIHTIAGLGLTQSSTLLLTAPSTMAYGTGSVLATLAASPATGPITFFETSGSLPQTLSTVPLSANSATMSTAAFNTGTHHIDATYSGDTTHAAAQSTTLALTIAPAQLIATPIPINLLYGQPIPTLTGTYTGVLPQDANKVTITYSTQATPISNPSAYPITATLTGSGAGNYTLATAPAAVTITKAPATLTLTSPTATSFAIHAATTTTGTPTGTVSLLDGQTPIATATLTPTGDATLTPSLTAGGHTLTATYPGNPDFLPATSTPTVITIAPTAVADFTLAATGQTTLTVPSGTAAAFSFATTPVNGTLSSPIQLSASGLPTGATASFNPAYLPPGGSINAFILTIQTPKLAHLTPLFPPRTVVLLAIAMPLLLLRRRRIHTLIPAILATLLLATTTACGDRTNLSAATSVPTRTYTITVTGTATAVTGATLQHTATVTLNLQ